MNYSKKRGVKALLVKINGNPLDYDRIHQAVQDNTYDSLGNAIISKISDALQHTEWYQHTPNKFDMVQNLDHVKMICGYKPECYADSLNWSIMNKTALTSDVYKFISDRMAVIREGFQYNFLPKHILDLIDWHFVLDCISWFF